MNTEKDLEIFLSQQLVKLTSRSLSSNELLVLTQYYLRSQLLHFQKRPVEFELWDYLSIGILATQPESTPN